MSGTSAGDGAARVLVVQPELEDPPGLLGGWLVEAGCTLEVRHPYAGDPLPAPGEWAGQYAGLLVMGGAMGADDDDTLAWIGPLKHLLRAAVAAGVPTLGVCLGHQLLGSALGGRIGRNPRGQQVGLLPVEWTPDAAADPLFGPLATPRRGVQWNNDLVLEQPSGAVVLARTGHGEVQATRYAERAWGVQLHPEVDAAVVATWVTETERAELARRGVDADGLLSGIAAARAELDAAWQPLGAGFAAVVRDASRAGVR